MSTESVGTNEISPIKSSDINSPNVTNIPSTPAENVSAPAENVAEPAENVAEPAENVSAPAENVSAPAENVSAPAENVAEPAENVSAPAENVSAQAENVSAPAENVNATNVNAEEPTAAAETPAPENIPSNASAGPPALEPIAPVENTPYTLSPSQKAVLDAQEKELKENLAPIWEEEFKDIPEKYRPHAKAYDARSIVSYRMKYPGDEEGIEKKIQGYLERDRTATSVRMGETVNSNSSQPLSPPNFENVSNSGNFTNTNSNINSNPKNYLISMASHRQSFSPPAAIFREQVRKTREHLHTILKRTQKRLHSKATTSNTRKAAKSLVKEFRRETELLLREAKRQADQLENAAKARLRQERQQAYERIKQQAQKNLQAISGSVPTKNMTRRLAKARRNSSGRGVSAENFIDLEPKKSKKPRSHRAKASASINMNSNPMNPSLNSNIPVNSDY